MKKILIFALSLLSLFLFSCGGGDTEAEPSVLESNIYVVSGVDFEEGWTNMGWMFLKFHSDNVVERVDMFPDSRAGLGANARYLFNKNWGVYELSGRSLTVTFSGEEPIIGVVHDEGKSVTMAIGQGTFTHFEEARFARGSEILSQFD